MGLIGTMVKVDVDADGKASGAFLRARVAIEIDKPLSRVVMLRMSKSEEPRWFAIRYEKLPFYCFFCGVIGHLEIECPHPVPRNVEGKLPYDVQLRAPEERRRFQGFAEAAAESFGSVSALRRLTMTGCRVQLGQEKKGRRGPEWATRATLGRIGRPSDP